MKRIIYPKTFLLLGVFPLTAYALITFVYIIVGGVLNYLNVLPLNVELMMNYHVLTFCLPLGAVIGVFYWSRSKITIKNDELKVRTKLTQITRTSIKMDEIESICLGEVEGEDSTSKFHIHLKGEDIKIIEFWYDEQAMLEIAQNIKKCNPKIKMNTKLQAIMS